MKQWNKDSLTIRQYDNRAILGADAARLAGETIQQLLAQKEFVNIIFAAAPSQNEFLDALTSIENIEWNRINAFHMDEYVGLPADAPQTFRHYLDEHIFSKLPFHAIYYLQGDATDIPAECSRYASLLTRYPADIVCMGIGENGHIAFNDPHVADFEDKYLVKAVDLDAECRQQQVNDGCFASIRAVPFYALTLTIPALMQAAHIFCMVPGPKKASAVFNTLTKDVEPRYPSTILRKHRGATLFIDNESASFLG